MASTVTQQDLMALAQIQQLSLGQWKFSEPLLK